VLIKFITQSGAKIMQIDSDVVKMLTVKLSGRGIWVTLHDNFQLKSENRNFAKKG